MTQAIIDVAGPLGIAVHDHIIAGKEGAREPQGAEIDLNSGALMRISVGSGSKAKPWRCGAAAQASTASAHLAAITN